MTILIADDNALIRNWMKIMLRQAEGDQTTLLEAVDGDEAYALCMREPIDLLITDIRMPGRDGIELIKALRTDRPAIRTAVLTSYDDFSYVRVALKCGALDYILKAEMQQEDISSLMRKVRESIALSNASGAHTAACRADIQCAKQAYADFSRSRDGSAAAIIRACSLEQAGFPIYCMLLHLDDSAADLERAAEVCCNVLRVERVTGLCFPIDGKALLALYAPAEGAAVSEHELQLRLLSAIDQNLIFAKAGLLRQNVTLALERPEDFSATLRQTKALVDFQSYYETSVVPAGGIPPHSPKEGEFIHILGNLLSRQEWSHAAAWLQKYIADCHGRQEFPYRIRRAAAAGTQMMLNAPTFCSSQAEVFRRLDQTAQELGEAPTAKMLHRLVNQFCSSYVEYSGDAPQTKSPAVEQAVAFCNEHYREKISLERLSSMTGLNKSYFSQLFHKEMGMPFGDYLEGIRIQNAQRLLRSLSLSMSDIAEMVGFANQNYFTKVFKKQTGLVPSQYRRTLFQSPDGANEQITPVRNDNTDIQ